MTTITFNPVSTPLVVDIDGTLIKSDLLVEAVFGHLKNNPISIFSLLFMLSKGRAHFKDMLAHSIDLDPALLPYDQAVLNLIKQAVAAGRPVYLASASNSRYVSAIADHFGFFSGHFGSNATINNSGSTKANRLVETFGDHGFDYVGNDHADIPVWSVAAKRIGVRTPVSAINELQLLGVEGMHSPKPGLAIWLKLIRVHQYSKNALVFLPLLTAHKFDLGSLLDVVLAAISFSLCASSAYIFNDLIDLPADRGHPTKKNRPLAAGTIPIMQGVLASPILFLCSAAIAAYIYLSLFSVLFCCILP